LKVKLGLLDFNIDFEISGDLDGADNLWGTANVQRALLGIGSGGCLIASFIKESG
jgi:hypothetical protein